MSNYLLTRWQDATQELHDARREVESLCDELRRTRDAWTADQNDAIAARREVEELRGRLAEFEGWHLRCQDTEQALARSEAEIARLRAENSRRHRERDEAISELLEIRHAATGADRSEQLKLGDALRVVRSEIARLRALLKGALVPCPECGGRWHDHERGGKPPRTWVGPCRRCCRNQIPGYVPVEVDHE